MIAFSDAVVAIAITLLVLPLVDAASKVGDAPFEGSGVGAGLTAPVVGVAPTPDNDAY